VPAGIYAKQYLQKAGLWKKVIDKVVPTENVRACLAAVESGNVDAGIVYKTDALASRRVKIVAEAPADSHAPVIYPVAIVKDTKNPVAARRFLTFLTSPQAAAVFRKFGFTPAD